MNSRKSILQRGVNEENIKPRQNESTHFGESSDNWDEAKEEEIKPKEDNVKETIESKPKKYNNSILGEILKDTNKEKIGGSNTYQEEVNSKKLSSAVETLINMGTTEAKVSESGYDLMVAEFNKHLPLFTNYLHKEYRFVDEDFIYFYTDEIIFYGNEVARSPMGVKIADLLMQIIIDIFGFNKINISISKDEETSDKYKAITHQLTADLANIYANSLLNHHQNRYLINDELARKVLQVLRKQTRDIFTGPSIITRHVLDCYNIICDGVDNSFEMSIMDYGMPISVDIEDSPTEPKFKYNLTLEEIDYGKQYYYERLNRYLNMEKMDINGDEEESKDTNPELQGKEQQQEDYENEGKDEVEDLKEEIDKSIDNFNNIGEGYSLQGGDQYKSVKSRIEIIDSPQLDWTSRLREWIEYCKPKKVMSYSTPNRKLLYTGMILSSSGDNSQRMKQGLTIYIDTSTSINMEKIKRSVEILKSILSTYKGKIVLKTFTTEVKPMDINLMNIKTNIINLNLGGGTDIKVVIEDIENSKTKDYINIILTDGDIDWKVVEKAVNKKYKMAFLLTKPIPDTNLPKAKNIKIYEVV